jgi:hypothetical protein
MGTGTDRGEWSAPRSVAETDGGTRRDFVTGFLNTLRDMRRCNTVEKIGSGRGVRWKLVEQEQPLL